MSRFGDFEHWLKYLLMMWRIRTCTNRLQKNTAKQLRRYQADTPGRPLDEAVGKEPARGRFFPAGDDPDYS